MIYTIEYNLGSTLDFERIAMMITYPLLIFLFIFWIFPFLYILEKIKLHRQNYVMKKVRKRKNYNEQLYLELKDLEELKRKK